MAERIAAQSAAARRRLVEEIRTVAMRRKITYEYDKSTGEEAIRILYPPVFLPAAEVPALRETCLVFSRSCEKALGLFLERADVRGLFPLDDDEERFVFMVNPDRHAKRPAIWQRLDAALDPRDPNGSLRLMETNMNSVGGVYYAPAVEKLSMEMVLPRLLDRTDLDRISPNEDLERMLFDLMAGHAARLGAGDPLRVAVVENDPDATGPTETAAVIDGLCQLGADAFLARPEEFDIHGSRLVHLGRTVDLVYRLFEIREMGEMGLTDRGREALRLAFSANRVVSNLGGEFDHKSIFELFTSSAYDRYFSPAERRLFQKHALWTRLVRAAFTDSPDGSKIDLPEFAFRRRDLLVLKPNRAYGGEGIVIGRETDESAWQRAIESAMAAPGRHVVQLATPLPELPFSVVDPAGEVVQEQLNFVCGISATPAGFGVIGRASRSRVVNVAQHGGLVPVLRLA